MMLSRPSPLANRFRNRHWAARNLSLQFNRGHLLGFVLVLVLVPLLLELITPAPAPPATQAHRSGTEGFRGLPVTDKLTLEEAARNHVYYRMLTSVCHDRGRERASEGYAYLFHANSRYAQNGRWSQEMFNMAADSLEEYFGMDPVVDCEPDSRNFHGLNLDADLSLKSIVMNHVFFSRKAEVCQRAGNEVQARSYRFLADAELDKADNGRRSRAEIRTALQEAEGSEELPQIHGC